jgi:hypothetical protein
MGAASFVELNFVERSESLPVWYGFFRAADVGEGNRDFFARTTLIDGLNAAQQKDVRKNDLNRVPPAGDKDSAHFFLSCWNADQNHVELRLYDLWPRFKRWIQTLKKDRAREPSVWGKAFCLTTALQAEIASQRIDNTVELFLPSFWAPGSRRLCARVQIFRPVCSNSHCFLSIPGCPGKLDQVDLPSPGIAWKKSFSRGFRRLGDRDLSDFSGCREGLNSGLRKRTLGFVLRDALSPRWRSQ